MKHYVLTAAIVLAVAVLVGCGECVQPVPVQRPVELELEVRHENGQVEMIAVQALVDEPPAVVCPETKSETDTTICQ